MTWNDISKTGIGVLLGLLIVVAIFYMIGKMSGIFEESNIKSAYQACDENCFHPDQCTPVAYSFRYSCICDCEGKLVEKFLK